MNIKNYIYDNNLKIFKEGFNLAKNDLEVLKPLTELIFKVADCCLRFQKSQTIASGNNKNNQKNSGFKKVTFSIIQPCF